MIYTISFLCSADNMKTWEFLPHSATLDIHLIDICIIEFIKACLEIHWLPGEVSRQRIFGSSIHPNNNTMFTINSIVLEKLNRSLKCKWSKKHVISLTHVKKSWQWAISSAKYRFSVCSSCAFWLRSPQKTMRNSSMLYLNPIFIDWSQSQWQILNWKFCTRAASHWKKNLPGKSTKLCCTIH